MCMVRESVGDGMLIPTATVHVHGHTVLNLMSRPSIRGRALPASDDATAQPTAHTDSLTQSSWQACVARSRSPSRDTRATPACTAANNDHGAHERTDR
eukprot:1548835-Prymnesium_polylepis.1